MSYLDTRDLIERRDELTDTAEEDGNLSDEEADERDAIQALLDTVGDEAQHGVTLIPDYLFTDYARELAEDIYGRELGQAVWPFTCIDWDHAASELMHDYSVVDFDGTTYHYRS